MNRKMPAGITDFRTLVDGEHIFVDKSLLIADIIGIGCGGYRFLRPHGFGKTVSLDMLYDFFEHDVIDSREMFSSLKVSDDPEVMQHLGRYKVIRMDLSEIASPDMNSAIERFSWMMSRIYSGFARIFESEKICGTAKRHFRDIVERRADRALLMSSVSLLCKWARAAYGREAVILMDDYDVPIMKAVQEGYSEEFMNFYAHFMESSLKTNTDCRYAVVAGVCHISRPCLSGGLDNLLELDMQEAICDDRFGFSEDEVRALLAEAGLSGCETDSLRARCGGYHIGRADLYSPAGVIEHLQDIIGGDVCMCIHRAEPVCDRMISSMLSGIGFEERARMKALAEVGGSMDATLGCDLPFSDLMSSDERTS